MFTCTRTFQRTSEEVVWTKQVVVKVYIVTLAGFQMNELTERTRILHSHSCHLHLRWSVRCPTLETHGSLHHCKLLKKPCRKFQTSSHRSSPLNSFRTTRSHQSLLCLPNKCNLNTRTAAGKL